MTAHAVEFACGAGVGWRARVGELGTRLVGRWRLGLYAKLARYGLLRDLAQNFAAPAAKIPLAVRPLDDRDLPALFGHAAAATDLAERLEVAWRHAFIEKGARGGFVAIDERSNTPCYVQWLLRFWKTPTRRLLIAVSALCRRRWRVSPSVPAISARAR